MGNRDCSCAGNTEYGEERFCGNSSLLGLWGSLSHEAFEISKERARIVYVRHLPNMPLLPGSLAALGWPIAPLEAYSSLWRSSLGRVVR